MLNRFEFRVFLTKAKEPSFPNYLPIARGRKDGFMPFLKSIRMKWDANNLIQDLNSDCWFRFLQWYAIHAANNTSISSWTWSKGNPASPWVETVKATSQFHKGRNKNKWIQEYTIIIFIQSLINPSVGNG